MIYLAGCKKVNNGDSCYACNHTRHTNPGQNGFTCRQFCPAGFVAYKAWTCITEAECSNTELPGIPVGSFARDGDNNYKVGAGCQASKPNKWLRSAM